MRIKGPSGGIPPIDETDGAQAPEAAAPTEASAPAAGAGEVRGVADARTADLVGEVARKLRAGDLSAHEAVELLIEDAVRRQVGRASESPAVTKALKDILRRYTETDPYLAAKVRRLGKP